MQAAYPAPKHRPWQVQIEFLDGVVIDAVSDDDALDRWRRVASWTDPTAEADPNDWLERVLARVRVVYRAPLEGVSSRSTPTEILDAIASTECLIVRRK